MDLWYLRKFLDFSDYKKALDYDRFDVGMSSKVGGIEWKIIHVYKGSRIQGDQIDMRTFLFFRIFY